MDIITAYKTIENNTKGQMTMDKSNLPPAYNNHQQSNESAPPQPAFNMQANITTSNVPQLLPTANVAFPQPVGPKSMEMTCPSCRCRIKTRVRHRSTAKTHIACLILSWTCICCCLPYCMDSCRNANHFCPMCNAFIGTYAS